jgi:hypothetical protein
MIMPTADRRVGIDARFSRSRPSFYAANRAATLGEVLPDSAFGGLDG